MLLYYAPYACSMAARILAAEAGAAFDLVRVEIGGGGRLRDGTDFRAVNPKGQVPTLVLGDGERLTESGAVLPYLADRAPDAGLMGRDPMARYRVHEWLGFIGAELHKGIFYPIFWFDEHHKATARANAPAKLAVVDAHLAGRDWLVGEGFTAADAYMAWWLFLAPRAGLDLAPHAALSAYRERVFARTSVADIIADEAEERASDEAAS